MYNLLAPTALVGREWRLRVAGAEFDAIDMDFSIEKTARSEPNKCTLTVYNLNPESRALLDSLNLYDPRKQKTSLPRGNVSASVKAAKTGNIRVEIEAGYKGATSLLFRGDLRRAVSTRTDDGWKTVIEGEDGGRTMLSSRVSESFPAGTPKFAVVRRCAAAMGVGEGNLLEVADLLKGVYSSGTVLDGSAPDELSGILRSAKLGYSVQNGVLQFLRTGAGGLDRRAYLLSSETGLVGSPEKDATGETTATCLMIPGVSIGGYIQLRTTVNRFNGVYRIVGVTHTGQTMGQDWYHRLSLLPR